MSFLFLKFDNFDMRASNNVSKQVKLSVIVIQVHTSYLSFFQIRGMFKYPAGGNQSSDSECQMTPWVLDTPIFSRKIAVESPDFESAAFYLMGGK